MNQVRYIISDAAKKVNVESHVLRYWEEELSLAIPRNEMGHRYYREQDIELLQSIKKLKEEGFQLRAIKMVLPNISKIEKLDPKNILRLREELNEQIISMDRESPNHRTKNESNVITLSEKEDNTKEEMIKKEIIKEEIIKEEITKEEIIKEEKMNPTPGVSTISLETVETIDAMESTGKMNEFKAIMHNVIADVLRENQNSLSEAVGNHVSQRVIKEMDYMMRVKEEREEERFKKLDESIRGHQKSRKEIAATEFGRTRRRRSIFHK